MIRDPWQQFLQMMNLMLNLYFRMHLL